MRIISVNYMSYREEAEDFIGRITGIQMIALKSPTQLRWYRKLLNSDGSKEIIATWKKAVGNSKLGTMEVNIKFVPHEYYCRIKEIV